MFNNPSKKSFAPRLGLALEPVRRQEVDDQGRLRPLLPAADHVVLPRHDVPHLPVLHGRGHPAAAGVRPGHDRRAQRRRRRRPRCRSAPSSSSTTTKQPFMEQWHANIERDLGHSMVGGVRLSSDRRGTTCRSTATRTPRRPQTANGVKRLVPGATLRYPSWGRIRTRINEAAVHLPGPDGRASNKRYASGWQAQASYTYGNSHDTWSGGQIGGSRLRQRRRQRHRLVGSGIRGRARRATTSATPWCSTPSTCCRWGRAKTGFVGALIRGLADRRRRAVLERPAVHAVRVLRSDWRRPERHRPAEAERQRRRRPTPETADQWFDPSVFACPAAGVFGNATRNSLRGAGPEGRRPVGLQEPADGPHRRQFRLEAFNAFNRVNLGLPNATIFNAGGVRNATAGRITTTSTPARQLQLGVKLSF